MPLSRLLQIVDQIDPVLFLPQPDEGHLGAGDDLPGQRNANAQNTLGAMNDRGWGVPQDDSEAVKWYRKAAEQGNAAAREWLTKHRN